MSGSGGASGYDYQADAFALIASFLLAGQPLNLGGDPNDVPTAILMETGEAGDDLRVQMATGRLLDIQAKYHARIGKKFLQSVVRLVRGLVNDPHLRGVLLVDSESSNKVRGELARDVERLGRGRTDHSGEALKRVLKALKDAHVTHSPDVWQRLAIVTRDLDERSQGEESGLSLLRAALQDPQQARDAWDRLGKRGLRETKLRGRSDLPMLVGFLAPTIGVARTEASAAGAYLKYREWALECYSRFPIIGFRSVSLAAADAWDHLVEIDADAAQLETVNEEFLRYHGLKQSSDGIDLRGKIRTDDLLLMGPDCVVVGAAGGGKSALSRRLLVEGLREGMFGMRVPLKSLAARMDAGRTAEEAIRDLALDGSGISSRPELTPSLLIADGLDECGERRAEIAEHLVKWRRGHQHARVIVTSRSFGHSSIDLPGFLHCEIVPLTPAAVSDGAKRIYEMYYRDHKRAATVAEEFDAELARNHTAGIAARTPLLFGCLAALFAQGHPLSGRRAHLFGDVTDLLRNQPIGRGPGHAVNDAAADRVMEIAGWLLVDQPTLGKSELRDKVGEQLCGDGIAMSAFVGRSIASDAILFWEQRRLLERLTTGAREIETFVHLNLAEYAAGRFAAGLPATEIEAWIRRCHLDPQWRQPILLAAGCGAVSPIVTALLELNHSFDAENDAVALAAEAITEAEDVPATLIARTVSALGERMLSRKVGIAVQAAESLISLGPLVPALVSETALPMLTQEPALTKLAAEAVILAGAPESIPPQMPERWLEAYLPVPGTIAVPERMRPPYRDDLPLGAHDLNERCIGLALEALFKTLPRDRALNLASRFFARRRPLDILVQGEQVFGKYGCLPEFRTLTSYMDDVYRSVFPRLNTKRDKETVVALLDAIAANVGNPTEERPPIDRWKLISRVLSAMEFTRMEPFMRESPIGKREDQATLAFVVGRTISALGIDREALPDELGSAYAVAQTLSARGMYAHVDDVRIRVDWKRAAFPPAPDRVLKALLHRSSTVNYVGASLLEHGAAGKASVRVFTSALKTNDQRTLEWLGQIAPTILESDIAAKLVAKRLATEVSRPIIGLLHGLMAGEAPLLKPKPDVALLRILTKLTTTPDEVVARVAATALEMAG